MINMNWKVVNEKYLDYLRLLESRIPNSNYGPTKYKPFFGVLFERNDFFYITQISHAQPRHTGMSEKLDFKKIYDPKGGQLLAVVNLNYMFPISKNDIADLHYKDIDNFRTFSSGTERSKYISLLKVELSEINKRALSAPAEKIYEYKYKFPDNTISQRCFDFKALENHSLKWSPTLEK